MAKIYATATRTIELLPNPVGAPHDVGLSEQLSVVVPHAGANLIRNSLNVPYGDLPLMAFSTPGGTLPTWVTGASPFGPYAHQWNPASGQTGFQMVDQGSPVPRGTFTACFAIKGPCGAKWNVRMLQNSVGTIPGSTTIEANGCWQRVCVCGVSLAGDPLTNEFVNVFLESVSGFAPQDLWYTSNYMIAPGECCEQTFISGYGFGWPGAQEFPGRNGQIYRWLAGPHSSPSVRHKHTRSGGKVVNFADIGFAITSADGLRMTSVENVFQRYAKIDGSYAQDQFYTDSTVRLNMRYVGSDSDKVKNVSCLEEMFKRFSGSCAEPVQLLYQCRDECGEPLGEELRFVGWYDGGLEGRINDISEEDFAVTLRTNRPFWEGNQVSWEGPLMANGTNNTPGASGPAFFQNAYCVGFGKKSAVTTYPVMVIQAAQATLNRIENLDTGSLLQFSTAGVSVAANEVLVINTDPTNSSILLYDAAGNPQNAAGELVGPGVSSFRLEPGYNNIEIEFSNVTNPAFDPLNPPTGAVPPTFSFAWPTRYNSASEACICNEWGQCDMTEIEAGFFDFGSPVNNGINPPNNAPV